MKRRNKRRIKQKKNNSTTTTATTTVVVAPAPAGGGGASSNNNNKQQQQHYEKVDMNNNNNKKNNNNDDVIIDLLSSDDDDDEEIVEVVKVKASPNNSNNNNTNNSKNISKNISNTTTNNLNKKKPEITTTKAATTQDEILAAATQGAASKYNNNNYNNNTTKKNKIAKTLFGNDEEAKKKSSNSNSNSSNSNSVDVQHNNNNNNNNEKCSNESTLSSEKELCHNNDDQQPSASLSKKTSSMDDEDPCYYNNDDDNNNNQLQQQSTTTTSPNKKFSILQPIKKTTKKRLRPVLLQQPSQDDNNNNEQNNNEVSSILLSEKKQRRGITLQQESYNNNQNEDEQQKQLQLQQQFNDGNERKKRRKSLSQECKLQSVTDILQDTIKYLKPKRKKHTIQESKQPDKKKKILQSKLSSSSSSELNTTPSKKPADGVTSHTLSKKSSTSTSSKRQKNTDYMTTTTPSSKSTTTKKNITESFLKTKTTTPSRKRNTTNRSITSTPPPSYNVDSTSTNSIARRTRSATKATTASPKHKPDHDNDIIIIDTTFIEQMAKECWCCQVPLKLPQGQVCWYAMHSHIVLDVPVCSVCAEEVAAIEQSIGNQLQKKQNTTAAAAAATTMTSEDNDDEVRCSGCAETGCICLACDADHEEEGPCGRLFCTDCVAKAYGGSAIGEATVQKLINDDNTPWHCLACKPPAGILKIRKQVQDNAEAEKQDRNLEFLLGELEEAEAEKSRCLTLMDNSENDIEQIREEIRSANPSISEEELEEKVTEEVSALSEDQDLHERRINDFIAGILDELEQDHNCTAAMAYAHLDGKFDEVVVQQQQKKDDDDSDNDEELSPPSWLRKADKIVGKRIEERKKIKEKTDDNLKFVDVEDLGSETESESMLDDDDNSSRVVRTGFSRSVKPTKAQIEQAIQYENELNVEIVRTVTDKDDKKLLHDENQVGCGGAQRVRRDFQPRKKRSTTTTTDTVDQDDKTQRNLKSSTRNKQKKKVPDDDKNDSPISKASSMSLSPRKQQTQSPNSNNGSEASSNRKGLLLCKIKSKDFKNNNNVRNQKIKVDSKISIHLKDHQIDGIKFMWKNGFTDYAMGLSDEESMNDGGCVLAHSMGLGKSLSAIALLQTLYNNTNLRKFLLLIPVNTITNWVQELEKWTQHLSKPIPVTDLYSLQVPARKTAINRWFYKGGILLTSEGLLKYLKDEHQPDVLVIDEAHTFLKNPLNITFKKLETFKTKRKIAMTGSPFQNDLFEYYHMIKFLRPDSLPMDRNAFEREFVLPINKGMAKDANAFTAQQSLAKAQELNRRFGPFVDRVDATELTKVLPPIQHVVLHVRQTRVQTRLYQLFEKQKKMNPDYVSNNFFQQYAMLRPIHNHPGSLFYAASKQQQAKNNSKNLDDIEAEEDLKDFKWWEPLVTRLGEDEIKCPLHGNKIILLLHILAHAEKIGDKVLIFANSLSTLNYIEHVLALDDWSNFLPSLSVEFPNNRKLGGWKKSKDFLRIDGNSNAEERGIYIDQFEEDEGVKAFLMSKAGGIGINLISANRVVIMDNHFNPTIAAQAVARTYRFGQTKPVYCYQLLTEGTMEERVYGRCVTKTGVALRVVDNKTIGRHFSQSEMDDLIKNLTWVQCDKCEKWRVLPGEISADSLAEQWVCSMNPDTENNTCKASEKTQLWYEQRMNEQSNGSSSEILQQPVANETNVVNHDLSSNLDSILVSLLELNQHKKNSKIVCNYDFQERLLETTDQTEALVEIQKQLASAEASTNTMKNSTAAAAAAAAASMGNSNNISPVLPPINLDDSSSDDCEIIETRKSVSVDENPTNSNKNDETQKVAKQQQMSPASKGRPISPSMEDDTNNIAFDNQKIDSNEDNLDTKQRSPRLDVNTLQHVGASTEDAIDLCDDD